MNPLNDPTIAYLRALLGARVEKARAETDRGASAIEWAIITALLAGIAIAIGAIIFQTIEKKARSINTG
ncbi:hypothetical protein SMC26_36565 [Actinomadura fulvescens]|uniref:Integral membrane protein n=1 Tax=Actinomadura fulvescens TaxID=46160 RepID=A0ABP6CQY5_9ACTN